MDKQEITQLIQALRDIKERRVVSYPYRENNLTLYKKYTTKEIATLIETLSKNIQEK